MIVKIIVFFKKKRFCSFITETVHHITRQSVQRGRCVCVCEGGDSYNLIGSILFSDHKSTLIIIENKLYNLYIYIKMNSLNMYFFKRIKSVQIFSKNKQYALIK